MVSLEKNDKTLITVITSENNREYCLYSDGNLYERDSKGKLKLVDNVTDESKQLIKKIMNKLSAGKTDVIRTQSNQPQKKKEIDVDLPRL